MIPKEPGYVNTHWTLVERFRLPDLYQTPFAHHCNAVTEQDCLFLIVSDTERGDAALPLQVKDHLPHVLTEVSVKVGEGLIKEQHRWFGRQGARERNALLLPAGQAVRPPFGKLAQLHPVKHSAGHWLPLIPGDTAHPQPETNILHYGHERKEQVVLEYHRRAALLDWNTADAPIAKPYDSTVRLEQTADEFEQRRLAAAGGPDQTEQLAGVECQRDPIDCCVFSPRIGERDIFN